MANHTTSNIVTTDGLYNLLFLNPEFETETDEENRDYMTSRFLDAFAELDYKTGNWYWKDDAPDAGETIEAILDADDAPEGIRAWYEEH